MEFHDRLSKLMVDSGVTSAMIAELTAKNPGTISNYRTGKSFPDEGFFIALKQLIPNYDSNWLMYGEGDMPEIEKIDNENFKHILQRNKPKEEASSRYALDMLEKSFKERISELKNTIDILKVENSFLHRLVESQILKTDNGSLGKAKVCLQPSREARTVYLVGRPNLAS